MVKITDKKEKSVNEIILGEKPKKWFVIIIGFALAAIVFAVVITGTVALMSNKKGYQEYQSYTSYEIYKETNHLIYDSIKLALSREVDSYIASVSNGNSALNGLVLIENCMKYDIDICFVLAQGEQESHFGTQGLARKTNSVFNVYAYDGKDYNAINSKGKYKHPNDCVVPYLVLLKNRYLVDGKTEYDMLNSYTDAAGHRYASAENYEKMLFDKVQKIKNNTKIDVLYQALRKQKLIIG